MKSSLICCVETWLIPKTNPKDKMEEQNNYNIDGYSTHLNSVGAGKGIAIFSKPPFSQPRDYNGTNFQITKITSADLDVICVYRSQEGNKRELLAELDKRLTINKATYICGDFNICLFKEPQNVLTDTLKQKNFVQLVEKPTFKSGSLLDHGYIRQTNPFTVTTYAPYWSDHDSVLLVVHKESNGTFVVKQKTTKKKCDFPKKRKENDSPEKTTTIDSDFDDMDAAMVARMKTKINMGNLIKKAKRKLKDKSTESKSPNKTSKIDDNFDDMDATMETKIKAKMKNMGHLIQKAKRKLKAKSAEPPHKKTKHDNETDKGNYHS